MPTTRESFLEKYKEPLKSVASLALMLLIIYTAFFSIEVALANPSPFYVVDSGSMEPMIKPGDLVIARGVGEKTISYLFIPISIKGVDPADLKEGDIIIFWAPEPYINHPEYQKPIIHRIIAIKYENGKRYFKTKGDANPDPDPPGDPRTWWVPEDNVIAKYETHVRELGAILYTIKRPEGITAILLVIIAIIAVDALKNVRKK